MLPHCNTHSYNRLPTRAVKIGDLVVGAGHPIRIQTMTTTDTMDTEATVAQTIRCIEAGAELVRITAPSKKEAENLAHIKTELRRRGYTTPLVADIHFTPNAAEVAARIVEKVRVNPGNYVDKKKFEQIEYTDAEYAEEIERIRERFTPLVTICKAHGTAMRIGTNHGSLSDRIMSRYGDTAMGMVESAMEFLRVARAENYHQVVLSMKSSNPQVMVQAYRLLAQTMQQEFGECYPLHLGVTEAGDGEDGRIKSAVGIGTLLEEGLGDTIRVSLTEDPEAEIPVCKDIVKRYDGPSAQTSVHVQDGADATFENHGEQAAFSANKNNINQNILNLSSPFGRQAPTRRKTVVVAGFGGHNVPGVIADFNKQTALTPQSLQAIGYSYHALTDKWTIGDAAADFVYTGARPLPFALPGTLRVILDAPAWAFEKDGCAGAEAQRLFAETCFPVFEATAYTGEAPKSDTLNFVMLDADGPLEHGFLKNVSADKTAVLCLSSRQKQAVAAMRRAFCILEEWKVKNPAVLLVNSNWHTADEHLVHFATEAGALLLDGFGDGISLGMTAPAYNRFTEAAQTVSGRRYTAAGHAGPEAFLNNTAFSILQATRTRISKTEYISCPSCGRTLFDLQETTARIRAVTNHLKGVKIAIMGCIVNGPGEMADADFGYVGSGPGKITLYRGKEVVKRNVPSEVAVEELILLLKESGAWVPAGEAALA